MAKKKTAKKASVSKLPAKREASYEILRGQTIGLLELQVKMHLKSGYQLAGGVQVVMPEYSSNATELEQRIPEFFQAVYRHGD